MDTSDADLRTILGTTKCIACVGVSPNPVRPSYFVFRYMQLKRYRMIPVNPVAAGSEILGEHVYGDLSEIPSDIPVDMVDIFRRSEFVPEIAEAAFEHLPHLKTLWMQIGVEHAQTRARAEARGLRVVEDRCPKMEYQRLFGELRKAGLNTGVISSKLPRLG